MKIRGRPMNRMLLTVMIGTVTAVLLCAILLFLQMYQRSLYRDAGITGRRTISQVSRTVDEYLSDIDKVMQLLVAALEDENTNREDFFETLLSIRPDVIAASTYTARGELVHCYSLSETLWENPESNLSFDRDDIAQYHNGFISSPHVVTLLQGSYPWAVTMISRLNSPVGEEWIALDISCSKVSSYINGIGIGQRGYCFLLDQQGNIVYHPQQQLINSDLKREAIALITPMADGSHIVGNVIYTVETLSNNNWRVIGVSFVEELISQSVNDIMRILLPAAMVILLGMLLISASLSRNMTKPLRLLAGAMEQFERDGDNFVYRPIEGVREVNILSQSFGHMVQQIKQLVEKTRNEEINLRKTELRALQAQINPHFLYNTLDSISWMCEQGKNKEAVHMVNALATLFRISISRGHELIRIQNELQHAESYLQIQSYRYKNQFTYTIEAQEDCLDYLCNKITLQPIIENAIYHGINGLVDEGHIAIGVKAQGDDIVFTVEDNGNGMDEETISAILSKERSDHAGIGIKNVNDRLKIYFGERYGIQIDSVPDEGTCVSILMPKVREEAEYEKR